MTETNFPASSADRAHNQLDSLERKLSSPSLPRLASGGIESCLRPVQQVVDAAGLYEAGPGW